MPEGIAVLGESLLGRAKETNKRRAKANRREAYKIAFGTGAAKLANNALARKSAQFLQQERVLAAKARYKATADQASQIYSIRDAAAEKNQTMEDFFYENKYLPALKTEYEAQFGKEFTVDSYSQQMNEEARRLSVGEAAEFNVALTAANKVPTLGEASKNIDSLVSPPRNVGEAMVSGVSNFFKGKTSGDVRNEILDRVESDGIIRNESVKIAFDSILRDSGASAAADWARTLDKSEFKDNVVITDVIDYVVNDNEVILNKHKIATDHQGNVQIMNPTSTVRHMGSTVGFNSQANNRANIGLGEDIRRDNRDFLRDNRRDAQEQNNTDRDFGFRASETLRDQENIDRNFGLQSDLYVEDIRQYNNDRSDTANRFTRGLQQEQNQFEDTLGNRKTEFGVTSSQTDRGLNIDEGRLRETVRSNIANESATERGLDFDKERLSRSSEEFSQQMTFKYEELLSRESQARSEFEQRVRGDAQIRSVAYQTLNEDGYARFVEGLDKIGISPSEIEASADNFKAAGNVYKSLAQSPAFLRNDIFDEGLFTLYGNMIDSMGTTLSGMEFEGKEALASYITGIFNDLRKVQTELLNADRAPAPMSFTSFNSGQ